jgi:hypothetical protein
MAPSLDRAAPSSCLDACDHDLSVGLTRDHGLPVHLARDHGLPVHLACDHGLQIMITPGRERWHHDHADLGTWIVARGSWSAARDHVDRGARLVERGSWSAGLGNWGAGDSGVACTRWGRVLNKELALAWCECQPSGEAPGGGWSGRWGPAGRRRPESDGGRSRSSRAIRPDRRARRGTASVLEGAYNSVQEDNAEWPRLSRSTRTPAAGLSGE